MIDGMTDPHFQVERYGHLAPMGSVRYVDTCGGFPPETLRAGRCGTDERGVKRLVSPCAGARIKKLPCLCAGQLEYS